MPEVAGAAVIVLATGATELAVLQNSHAGIGESCDLAFLGAVASDLHHGSSDDLIRAKHSELDADDRFSL
jgi:hypothetical protein